MNTIPAGYKMSAQAVARLEGSHMLYMMNGWTDEQMIEHGILELIHPKKTVADAWEQLKGVLPIARVYAGIGVSSTGTIVAAMKGSAISKEKNGTYMICTCEEFEEYGNNRKVQADKTANAMVEKFEKVMSKWVEGEQLLDARQLSKAGNIALAARTGTNAVNQFAKQFKAMEKIRADILQEKATSELTERDAIIVQGNTAVVIDWKTCKVKPALSLNNQKLKTLQTELNKSRETNNFIQKESRILQRVAIEHKAIIESLHEELKELGRGNREQAIEIREQAIEIREKAVEIAYLKAEINFSNKGA
jgi:hypothetical protein